MSADLELPVYKPQFSEKYIRDKYFPISVDHTDNSHFPYLIVCPDVGKTLSVRNYSKESYRDLIGLILDEYPEMRIGLVGTLGENETCQWLEERVGSTRCVNFCGRTTFMELLAIITYADLTISNDNGIAHFAALTRTNSIALFSTDSPFVYGPLGHCAVLYSYFHCSPCIMAFNHKSSRCNDNKCLQVITPTKIFEYVKKHRDDHFPGGLVNGEISYIPKMGSII